jgi:hypothetical protein
LTSAKLAVGTPVADARTVYAPDTVFAVPVIEAMPFVPVTLVVEESVAFAPLAGPEKVTVTPDIGFP